MRTWMGGLTLGCAAVLGIGAVAAADGHARVVIPFEMGEAAEGVAVDLDGGLFAGQSAQGRMLKVPPGREEAIEFAAIDGLVEGDFGLTGHGFGGDGALYSGVVSSNPELNGVVGFDLATGTWRHVPGTEQMAMANAIASDGWGTLYVTDSIMGAVWRVTPFWEVEADPIVESWVVDPLLEGTGELPLPFPVGTNGIAIDEGTVYVANTEKVTIVAIPILDDGSAGKPEVFLEPQVYSPDGIAFDQEGNLYVADPPAHTLWKVAPDGSATAVADIDDGLSGPSSVALWTDDAGVTTAYVSNQAIGDEETIEHDPSIIAVTLE